MTRLREGVNYARRTPMVLSILIFTGFIGMFGFNFTVITPLVADNVLQVDAAGFGLLSAAMGVGALGAALTVAFVQRVSPERMLLSGAVFGVFLSTLGLSQNFAVSMLLFMVVGYTGILSATVASSLLQLNTPEQLRGRVLSINLLLTMGSTPIGGFFVGTVAQIAGIEAALVICAVLCLVGVSIAAYYRRRMVRGGGALPG